MSDLAILETALGFLIQAVKGRPNLAAGAWAREHAAGLITDVSPRTETRIRNLIATSLEDGWSTTELADALEALGLDADRAATIADHERTAAVHGARLEAWETRLETGTLTDRARKVWDAGEEFCPICEHLDGQTQFVDEPFDSDLGPVDTVPAHIGCDCNVRLVKG